MQAHTHRQPKGSTHLSADDSHTRTTNCTILFDDKAPGGTYTYVLQLCAPNAKKGRKKTNFETGSLTTLAPVVENDEWDTRNFRS